MKELEDPQPSTVQQEETDNGSMSCETVNGGIPHGTAREERRKPRGLRALGIKGKTWLQWERVTSCDQPDSKDGEHTIGPEWEEVIFLKRVEL